MGLSLGYYQLMSPHLLISMFLNIILAVKKRPYRLSLIRLIHCGINLNTKDNNMIQMQIHRFRKYRPPEDQHVEPIIVRAQRGFIS